MSDRHVTKVLQELPTGTDREIESQLMATLRQQQIDDAIAATQGAIELDQAEASVREAAAVGDLRRM